MVVVKDGRTLISGDCADIALDIITFIDSVNEIKRRDYEQYKVVESAIKELTEVETPTLDVIKEFAINMTEIFS